MVNKDGLIICDCNDCPHIVLNDGVTLYSGYVEIKDGMLMRYDSKDPHNELAKIKPWVLHNRVKYQYVAHQEPCTNEQLQGKHFMSKIALEKYLTTSK